MKPKPNKRHKTFNLDADATNIIQETANIQGISMSDLIETWAYSWEQETDPVKKLTALSKKKEELNIEIKLIEEQEKKVLQLLTKREEWIKKKQETRPKIVSNLMRILTEKRYDDAEQIAKTQAIKLGVPYLSLIHEAMERLTDGQ
jgi:metal-dependent amidase/aminoacylase/carboxypeptidase family protein